MSALPPIADIRRLGCDVRFVPKRTHALQQKKRRLFDHLVGAQQKVSADGQTERLRCLQVDDEFEFARLLDRQIGPATFP